MYLKPMHGGCPCYASSSSTACHLPHVDSVPKSTEGHTSTTITTTTTTTGPWRKRIIATTMMDTYRVRSVATFKDSNNGSQRLEEDKRFSSNRFTAYYSVAAVVLKTRPETMLLRHICKHNRFFSPLAPLLAFLVATGGLPPPTSPLLHTQIHYRGK
jgi:hypothetical protein